MGDLVLAGSTSGTVTLSPPASAGTTTLTLPTTSGTIVTTNTMPTGSVLQVVNASTGSELGNNSSTYADTGLTASITPSSSSNKILVLVSQNGLGKDGGGNTRIGLKLLRGSTSILQMEGIASQTGTTTTNFIGGVSTSYLDSPATTSSVTYKTQISNLDTSGTVRANTSSGAGKESYSTITLMEIKA